MNKNKIITGKLGQEILIHIFTIIACSVLIGLLIRPYIKKLDQCNQQCQIQCKIQDLQQTVKTLK